MHADCAWTVSVTHRAGDRPSLCPSLCSVGHILKMTRQRQHHSAYRRFDPSANIRKLLVEKVECPDLLKLRCCRSCRVGLATVPLCVAASPGESLLVYPLTDRQTDSMPVLVFSCIFYFTVKYFYFWFHTVYLACLRQPLSTRYSLSYRIAWPVRIYSCLD